MSFAFPLLQFYHVHIAPCQVNIPCIVIIFHVNIGTPVFLGPFTFHLQMLILLAVFRPVVTRFCPIFLRCSPFHWTIRQYMICGSAAVACPFSLVKTGGFLPTFILSSVFTIVACCPLILSVVVSVFAEQCHCFLQCPRILVIVSREL